MEELLKTIETVAETFKVNAVSQNNKGNKSAGLRARKASLDLEKALSEFKKNSSEPISKK